MEIEPDTVPLMNPPLSDRDQLMAHAARVSVTVAGTLILAKAGVYFCSGSVAILASLADSTVDLMASLFLLGGVHIAVRPPDRDHRFGHGKAEALAAFAQAAFILGSVGVLTYQAIQRIVNPELATAGVPGIILMVASSIATVGLVLYQRSVIRRTGSIAIAADSVHYQGDLALNSAVLTSIVLTLIWPWPFWDPIFALLVAAFLVRSALAVARDAVDQLMDKEAPRETRTEIERVTLSHPDTRGMHDLRTRQSSGVLFVDLHLELDAHLSLQQAHDITNEVEALLSAALPHANVTIHQEPAGLDDHRLDDQLAD